MFDHVDRFIGQLDSQRSISDPKRGNVTSTPQTFTFGPQILVVQAQTLMKTFVSLGKFTYSGFKFFRFAFIQQDSIRMSLRRFNLIMTFFRDPLEGKR